MRSDVRRSAREDEFAPFPSRSNTWKASKSSLLLSSWIRFVFSRAASPGLIGTFGWCPVIGSISGSGSGSGSGSASLFVSAAELPSGGRRRGTGVRPLGDASSGCTRLELGVSGAPAVRAGSTGRFGRRISPGSLQTGTRPLTQQRGPASAASGH